jgi:trans-aconitate 2-methyltransferase
MTTTPDWDARSYDRIADPQARWGLAVLDRLALDGDERVLDAGCGSGRVTEALAERLPRGHLVALDQSAAMLDEARRRLARFGDRVEFVVADLGRPLPVDPVDAILSTATFHWVPDHDALFRHLAAVLRPGGRLVAQCGGAGNIEHLLQVVERLGQPRHGQHHFETAEATSRRLREAGFDAVQTWLSDEPTRFESRQELEAFLATVCLRAHLPRLPEADRAAFVRAVADGLPGQAIDYVRLNIVARRAG